MKLGCRVRSENNFIQALYPLLRIYVTLNQITFLNLFFFLHKMQLTLSSSFNFCEV